MVTFQELVTDQPIIKAINDLGFTEPTEIQAATIPFGLQGRDVIGQAKTGSGKTFAFGIPIVHNLTAERVPQALVIAPTRELCAQIAAELEKLLKYKNAEITTVYGGVGINPQIDALRTAQIVVGTPGRLLDHLYQNTLKTDKIRTLVLDEADRMLDMGFIEDIQSIVSALPEDRQTLLFSATMPSEIKSLAANYQNNPEHIKTTSHVEEHYLPQFYYVVERDRKFSLLVHLLNSEEGERAIVFCATRHIADAIGSNLQRHGLPAEAIHGGLSQAKRDKIMEEFRSGKTAILIATDVAARGLDIKNVTHVFNYDVPKNSEDYVHRIGRTARAGETGKAITLLENRDFEFFQGVLNLPNVNPTELHAGNYPSVGFRKHMDGEGDSRDNRSGGRPRGDFGGRPPRRDNRRESGGYASASSEREPRESKSDGGWKQSRRSR